MELQNINFPKNNMQPLRLTVSGSHKIANDINKWPEESRKDITLMITSAQQIAKKINGLKDENRYKVNVRQNDKLVCSVYPNRIEWMPGAENIRAKYYPQSETALRIQNAFFPPPIPKVEIKENELEDEIADMWNEFNR